MWWAVYIAIITAHYRGEVVTPQVFGTYGACQQFADKIADAPLPKRKATMLIMCKEAVGDDERKTRSSWLVPQRRLQ